MWVQAQGADLPFPKPTFIFSPPALILSGPNRKPETLSPFPGSTFNPPSEGRYGPFILGPVYPVRP